MKKRATKKEIKATRLKVFYAKIITGENCEQLAKKFNITKRTARNYYEDIDALVKETCGATRIRNLKKRLEHLKHRTDSLKKIIKTLKENPCADVLRFFQPLKQPLNFAPYRFKNEPPEVLSAYNAVIYRMSTSHGYASVAVLYGLKLLQFRKIYDKVKRKLENYEIDETITVLRMRIYHAEQVNKKLINQIEELINSSANLKLTTKKRKKRFLRNWLAPRILKQKKPYKQLNNL